MSSIACRWVTFAGLQIAILFASRHAAAQTLHIESVGSIGPIGEMTGYVNLNGDLLVSVGASLTSNQTYHHFDGAAFAGVANTSGAPLPRLTTFWQPTRGNAVSGHVHQGDYYFTSVASSGTALFKTDGSDTQLVSDFDPNINSDQTIRQFASDGANIFVVADGNHGRELFRVTGDFVFEYDINPIPGYTLPTDLHLYSGQALFTARSNLTGFHSIYRTNGNQVEFLADGSLFSPPIELGGRLHWMNGSQLQSYDGANVTAVPQFSGITSLNLSPSRNLSSNFLTLTGVGPNGWTIYTSDGVTRREFDVDPSGLGSPVEVVAYLDGAFYATRTTLAHGTELYRIDETSATLFDLAPGSASSNPYGEVASIVNGTLIIPAYGPAGQELYRASGSGVELLADVNPGGDAFPLSIAPLQNFQGELYFRAYSPLGAEIYKTDGANVTLLADLLPGPGSSNGNFGSTISRIPGSDLISIRTESPAPVGPFVSDGDTVWNLTQEVDALFAGQQYAGLAAYQGDLLYFSKSGQVYRISVVPEPLTVHLLLGMSAVFAVRRERRCST
jgi:ELWxxDGT repeat protein